MRMRLAMPVLLASFILLPSLAHAATRISDPVTFVKSVYATIMANKAPVERP